MSTRFEPDKVLDRPSASVVSGPGAGARAGGYRIHHGRVTAAAGAERWLVTDDGTAIGWRSEHLLATSLHGLFEDDDLRAAILSWAADRSGIVTGGLGTVSFVGARQARLDLIADTLDAHLDVARLFTIIEQRRRPRPNRVPTP